jgi:hypothetical protein
MAGLALNPVELTPLCNAFIMTLTELESHAIIESQLKVH